MYHKNRNGEIRIPTRLSLLSFTDLSYFCPIDMLLIDPMHNLFLGTAKHFARDLWIGRNFLLPGPVPCLK